MPNKGHENQPSYSSFSTESIDIDAAAEALPATGVGLFYLRAHPDNSGTITLGSSSSVTSGAGWTLAAGDISPPIVLDDLSKIYAIGSAADQVLEVIRQY